MIKKGSYFVFFMLLIGCKTDDATPDCAAVLCVTPNVLINFVDDATEENYIIKNSITKERITIEDDLGNPVEFSILENNGFLFVNKQKTKGVFKIYFDTELTASISYNTSKPNTNVCCDFGNLKDVVIANKNFTVKDGVITIYL